MDDATKKVFIGLAAGLIKKGLMLQAAGLVSHGVLTANQTETYVSVGMALVGAAWSFWDDYGRAIVLSQLEVFKAKSLAQAEKLRQARIPQVTVTDIANQSDNLSPKDVAKAVAKMPPASQAAVMGVTKVLIVAFALSLFLAGGQASAAPRGMRTSTSGLPCDPANLLPGCQSSSGTSVSSSGNPIASLLSKPMQDLANFISKGFNDAVDLSTAVPELQDGNGQACWGMMRNYSVILQKHPIPVTMEAAYDLEAIRLLNMAANKICQNTACTQVFTEAGNLINASVPLNIPLPNLTALCSKVPEIAVVAPTVLPSPPIAVSSPSPSPTPSASPTATPSPAPSPSASP